MQIIDSLHSVFDKKSNACVCTNGTWAVYEEKEVAFKKVTFHCEGACFGVLNNEFYKAIKETTENRSSFLKDSDCDGISFFDDRSSLQLLLVDLKSSFSEQNISKAFKQDFFSLLKIHMMLSLCEGYSLDSLLIRFFAVCPPCASLDDKAIILDRIYLGEESDKERFENKYLMAYFKKGVFSCKMKDIPFVKDKHLNEDLLDATIQFQIVTAENYEDRECVMEL